MPGARVPNPAETLTPAGPPNSGSYCDPTAAGRTSAWGPTLSSGPIPSKGDDVAHHRAGGPDRPPRHPRPDRPEQAPQRGARRARRVNARGARRRSHRGHRRAGAVRRLRPAPFRGGGRRAARPGVWGRRSPPPRSISPVVAARAPCTCSPRRPHSSSRSSGSVPSRVQTSTRASSSRRSSRPRARRARWRWLCGCPSTSSPPSPRTPSPRLPAPASAARGPRRGSPRTGRRGDRSSRSPAPRCGIAGRVACRAAP